MKDWRKAEARDYILKKLSGAGCRDEVFEEAALEAVINASDGVSRVLNRYCSAAMLVAAADKRRVITADDVRNAINDCSI